MPIFFCPDLFIQITSKFCLTEIFKALLFLNSLVKHVKELVVGVKFPNSIALFLTLLDSVSKWLLFHDLEKFCIVESDGIVSNRGIFRPLSAAVCSCLSQMGDSSLVLKLLCRNIFNEMSKNLSVDNMYGLLRMIVGLDTRPTKLSEDNISNLSNWLFVYLVEAASYIPEQIGVAFHSDQIHMFRYYVQPCIFLFNRSDRLLFHALKLFDSSILEENLWGFPQLVKPFDRVRTICSVLIFMHDDARLHRSLSSCKAVIQSIHQNVLSLLESSTYALTLEEKHSIQTLFHQMKSKACKLQCSDASNLERV